MNIIAFMLLFGLSAYHPVHVSYTNIDIIPETGEINLVYKFFTDDLKLLFYHVYDRQLSFDPEKELTSNELSLVKDHLLSSFLLKEPVGKAVDFLYIKKEQNEESVWIYFKGKLAKSNPDNLFIKNTLLLDLFEDQKNLLIFKYGSLEKGYSFDYLTQEINIDMKSLP